MGVLRSLPLHLDPFLLTTQTIAPSANNVCRLLGVKIICKTAKVRYTENPTRSSSTQLSSHVPAKLKVTICSPPGMHCPPSYLASPAIMCSHLTMSLSPVGRSIVIQDSHLFVEFFNSCPSPHWTVKLQEDGDGTFY